MFGTNKLVLILPLFLMVFLFVGGAIYVNQAEEISNENLSEEVEWEKSFSENESGSTLEASWNWGIMPDDGMQGTDYIGVTLLDANGDPISGEEIKTYELTLHQNDEADIIEEGQVVENGILFSFPNEMQENQTIGDSGSLHVSHNGDNLPEQAVISYLHTWEDHGGLDSQDARFFNRDFVGKNQNDESFFWVMETFEDLNQMEAD
ncbi:hypothetical protein D7Z54_23525 [Salibacterium salarium]|uniref:Uncharacterized protein n=1 Tax=Salibacterium salarium TaxID=284579 RepID=A0A428MXQ7_9BACI|nr:hypothetical protein [Salibacterium salarium]RSL30938.1 hypothetical protein D7Z54_23525 [Salibacterium salarium]